MKAKIKTRIATQEESIRLANATIPNSDKADMDLPNGHKRAIRLLIDCSTNGVWVKNGNQMYCAPWLLNGVF